MVGAQDSLELGEMELGRTGHARLVLGDLTRGSRDSLKTVKGAGGLEGVFLLFRW